MTQIESPERGFWGRTTLVAVVPEFTLPAGRLENTGSLRLAGGPLPPHLPPSPEVAP